MTHETLIDAEAIENLRALNPDDADGFVKELVVIFLDDTPQRIEELNSAFATGDVPKFTRAAHSIKGSSSNMGARHLRNLAEKLEHDSKKHGLSGLDVVIAELEKTFAETKVALNQIAGL